MAEPQSDAELLKSQTLQLLFPKLLKQNMFKCV